MDVGAEEEAGTRAPGVRSRSDPEAIRQQGPAKAWASAWASVSGWAQLWEPKSLRQLAVRSGALASVICPLARPVWNKATGPALQRMCFADDSVVDSRLFATVVAKWEVEVRLVPEVQVCQPPWVACQERE